MNDELTATAPLEPALYLFPVPLSSGAAGEVLPERNLRIIRQVRHFIVENVRSARRFLKLCDRNIDINALSFVELNRHTDPLDIPRMLDPLINGEAIGVISEAGCPAIADPGADVVALAQQKGLKVVPLVGPSSILMGLMGSGFNGQSFAFAGYLPIEREARNAMLRTFRQRIERDRQTQIFIETPYRNNKLIAELAEALPPSMRLCVAADISGPQESIITRPVAQWRKASYDYSKTPAIFLLYN